MCVYLCLYMYVCDHIYRKICDLFKKMFALLTLDIERITQTVEIIKHTVGIEEKGVKLKLSIVDTPGFGDAVNNTER